MKQWYKVLKLTWGDRRLLFNTFALLNAIRLGLWLLPFQKLCQILQAFHRVPSNRYPVALHRIIWAVEVSSRYTPGGAKCLARALTAQTLMTRHAYPVEFRIGIAKGETGQFEAHAWIEYEGKAIVGKLPDLSRYVPLPSFQGV